MNAEQRVVGQAASHTFDGVGRLAPEDYLRFGKMVQSKFYMGVSGTLTAIADHLDTYPWFLDEGGSYDIAKNHYNELMRIYQGGATGAALTDSDRKLYEAIKDWETLPVPILGAIIGNTVGMFMMNIARSYMSAEEQKLIEAYQKEMSAIKSQLDTEYKALVEKLEAELAEYDSLVALAFDADINIRFSSIISRARLVGANTARLVGVEAGAELFTSGAPVVL